MHAYARRTVAVTQSLVDVVRSESVTFVAAGLAYYAFVSLLPLLLLALVAAATFGGPEMAAQIETWVTETLGPGAGDTVHGAITSAGGRGGATVVGIAVLLWSGLKVFRGMDLAFSQVYGTDSRESFLTQVGDAVLVLAAVGAAVVLTVVVGTVLSVATVTGTVAGVDLVSIAGSVFLVLALTVTLLPLYYFLPDLPTLRVEDALPGAIFAAVGWTVLQTVFRFYAGTAGSYEAYGVIGGVLLLVTFLYFGGIVLLTGVALNAVLDGRIGPQAAALGIDSDHLEDAVPHDTKPMTDQEEPGPAGTAEEPDEQPLETQVAALRAQLDEKTVNRDDLERELRRYVRRHVRRGKARGWGPYLVLLYGTAMTLGAFYFLNGIWAILAMIVIWLSTLGLYVLMLLVGVGLSLASVPGRFWDAIDALR